MERIMKRQIQLQGTIVTYELTYKRVKNINLRIKADGTVHVSANRRVPQSVINALMQSKAAFVVKALETYKNRPSVPLKQHFTESEIREVILNLCQKVYPYFEARGVAYPQIKFRKMVSQWGNCRSDKGILTFNTNLMYADYGCVEYVVLHEFTHFLQANHSARFYEELAKTCPDWKERKKRLKEVKLR